MAKYCVIEKNFKENHAGSKAREDVARIATDNGWSPLVVHHSEQKGTLDKLRMTLLTVLDWNRICKKVPDGAELLIQYPLAMYPKVSKCAIPFLKRLKEKKVRLLFLIHDLDSLRGFPEERDQGFLQLADVIIAHNPVMIDYLKNRGYSCSDVRSLGIFDYLTDAAFSDRTGKKDTVLVAGNLSPDKAGYAYQLHLVDSCVKFHLYGPHFAGIKEWKNSSYIGQYPAEELPGKMDGGFGLVWDGYSLEQCSGAYGEYMKYNNPHKTSLYLASGIPVIIWKQAAMAAFIEQEHAGIAVESLHELPDVIGNMTDEEYRQMQACAQQLGRRLRSGEMLLKQLY